MKTLSHFGSIHGFSAMNEVKRKQCYQYDSNMFEQQRTGSSNDTLSFFISVRKVSSLTIEV